MSDLAHYGWLALSSTLFCLGIVATLVARRQGWWIALTLTLVGSLVAAVGVIPLFLYPPDDVAKMVLWHSAWIESGQLPDLQLELRVDRLAAFFIVLIGVFAAIVAIYCFGALTAAHYLRRRRAIAAAFALFVWSTLLVVVANDVFSLMAALELMTLAFSFLTLYKHYHYLDDPASTPDAEAVQNAWLAPRVYLIVSHTSTVLLGVALLLLAINAKSLSFDELRKSEYTHALSAEMATTIFLLVLLGTGIRAGLLPFHFWVPLVHPASPTTTHAFSLGIAIKVAIYLMLRCFFQFLVPQSFWGYIVLLIAGGTALVSVWYAIASHDLKTALAYHSVENIGIIVAGVGVALIFYADPTAPSVTNPMAQWITALALVAALYHLLNHAVFKGLLYLCTGAIDHLTGQIVEIERLGGLFKRYPKTAAAFLVGALAIAGFPPLNGFVSEWLTLQALLHSLSVQHGQIGGVIILLIGLVLLVAAFALTAFCFLKIVGLALLGPPRADAETQAQWSKHDAPPTMIAMMVLLVALCLALGVMPGFVVTWLTGVVATILNSGDVVISVPPQGWSSAWVELSLRLPPTTTNASQPPPTLPIFSFLLVSLILGIVVLLLRLMKRQRRTLRPDEAWAGGTPPAQAHTWSSGASLSYMIRANLGGDPTRPLSDRVPIRIPFRFALSESDTYPQRVVEIFRVALNYGTDRILRWSEWLGGRIQNGDLRSYLLYIFLAAATVLAIFLWYILVR